MAGSRGFGLGGPPLRSRYTWFRDGRFFRAVAHCIRGDWPNAEADLKSARHAGLRVASSFQNKFGGVERFEREYDVKLPSLIKTQLHVRENG